MTPPNAMRGLAFSEILIWLLILAVIGSILIKFVPVYIDHQTAVSIIEDLAQNAEMDRLDPSELQEVIERRFKTNNLRDFIKEKRFQLRSDSGRSEAVLQYEVRGNLAVNIDYLIVFDDTIELGD